MAGITVLRKQGANFVFEELDLLAGSVRERTVNDCRCAVQADEA